MVFIYIFCTLGLINAKIKKLFKHILDFFIFAVTKKLHE